MTIRIMQPIQITEDDINFTNVDLEPAWTDGTYPLGTKRRVGERLYEVSADTTSEEPSPTATEWFDIGPANRYAAFDLQFGADKFRVVESETRRRDFMEYEFRTLPQITGMAFFGVEADNIKVFVVVNGVSETVIDYDLTDGVSYEGSFYRWLFVPSDAERKYVNLSLNIPANTSVRINITNTGSEVAVGSILMGIFETFNTMESGVVRSLRSRSIKDTTGVLTSLLRRTSSSRVTYPIYLDDRKASAFWRLVDELDGVAGLFAAPDDFPELTVYGFITSAQTTAMTNGISRMKLEVESL